MYDPRLYLKRCHNQRPVFCLWWTWRLRQNGRHFRDSLGLALLQLNAFPINPSPIAWFMGPTWGLSGAAKARWALCWAYELSYLGLHTKFFIGNIKYILQLIAFHHTDTTQVDGILRPVRQGRTYSLFISCVLISWLLVLAGHQQPSYLLFSTRMIKSHHAKG